MTRENESHGLVAEGHDEPPGLDHFVRIRGPQGDQTRDCAQGGQMLHGLVRGPIFPNPNRIVRENVDHGNFHERAQSNRRSFVIAENQEA